MHNKKQFMGERVCFVHDLRMQSITLGKARWPEQLSCEAVDHVACTVQKQRKMNAGTQLTFCSLFIQPWTSAHRMAPSTVTVRLHSVKSLWKTQRHASRCISKVMPNSSKLTVKITVMMATHLNQVILEDKGYDFKMLNLK